MAAEPAAAEAVEEGALLIAPCENCREVRQLQLWRACRVAAVATTGGLCVALVLGSTLWQGVEERTHSGDVHKDIGLVEMSFWKPLLEGISATQKGMNNFKESMENAGTVLGKAGDVFQQINHSTGEFALAIAEAKEKVQQYRYLNASRKAEIREQLHKKYNITVPTLLGPHANLTDGNPCLDDEEFHGGLCYKKCSLLGEGQYPQRVSGFECCEPDRCSEEFSFSMGICEGNNVAGDSIGGGCPHVPGACLKNEEIHLGLCYKKCEWLTWTVLPHRWGPATCCQAEREGGASNSLLKWLYTKNCHSNASYNVGGGDEDDDSISPGVPHPPMLHLTEPMMSLRPKVQAPSLQTPKEQTPQEQRPGTRPWRLRP